MKTRLEPLIQKTLSLYSKRKGVSLPSNFEYEITVTKDSVHGDFASNVAFKLARVMHEKPSSIADQLVLLIEEENQKGEWDALLERLEVAGGGFINFFLTKQSLASILFEVQKENERYGHSDFGKGKKVLLEYVSANPTGPLTIAHGRQAAVGNTLARILKASGHQVSSEYYLNDAGRQMNLLGASLWARYLQEWGREVSLPEDGYQGEYLQDLAKQLRDEKADSLMKLPEADAIDFCRRYAGETILKGIREDLDSISVFFDHYVHESDFYKRKEVDQALNYLTDHSHLYEKEGALWFHSTAFGDDKDRVVKKATGEYTYLAPDIAYHRHKFSRGYSWLINFWGPDHHGYVARLKAACQALGHDASQIEIRIVQLTTLFRKGEPVRMSTRAGEFVTLRELVREVGPDAARFFFCMRKIESPLDFDLDLAKQKSQENPVYYFQYAHARIASILRFAQRPVPSKVPVERLDTPEEVELIKAISEFPQSIVKSSEMLEPYRVVDYLRDLAALFHKFYTYHRVVTEDEALTDARLLLVDCTRIVLKNGLEILGVSHPEFM